MGSTKIESPSVPAAPTQASTMSDYVSNYPALFNLMKQYAPQEAQLNIDLANQYALPAAQALKTAQDALYPNETALTNTLTSQVQEGVSGDMPDWAKESYRNEMRGQLGENALSGSGADYMSRGMIQQQEDWRRYYQNLGLSITGKQPVYTAQNPGYTNQLGGYSPQTAYNYNANTYGSNVGAYSSMYGTNAQYLPTSGIQNLSNQIGYGMKIGGNVGSIMSGIGSFSSRRYKNRIRKWLDE